MAEETDPVRTRWTFALDLRDVLFVAGGGLVVVAAAATDWRLCVAAIGASLAWLARRLAG